MDEITFVEIAVPRICGQTARDIKTCAEHHLNLLTVRRGRPKRPRDAVKSFPSRAFP